MTKYSVLVVYTRSLVELYIINTLKWMEMIITASVAYPVNFAPDPGLKILDPDPDPALF